MNKLFEESFRDKIYNLLPNDQESLEKLADALMHTDLAYRFARSVMTINNPKSQYPAKEDEKDTSTYKPLIINGNIII